MLAILNQLAGETVGISQKRSGLVVSDETARFELAVPAHEGFPVAKEFDHGRWYEVDCVDLKAALSLTLFATAEPLGKYAIEGVLLELSDADTLQLVATDTRRLSAVPVPCDCSGEPDQDMQAVLPGKLGRLLRKLLPDEGTCRFAFGLTGGIAFEFGEFRIVSKLLDGSFPNWQRVFPGDDQAMQHLTFVSGELADVLAQAAITTSVESSAVDLEFADGAVRARSKASDVGAARIERALPFEATGKFSLNPHYLLDMLKAIGPDQQLAFEFTDSESPLLFSRDDGYRYLQMPLAREVAA